jgi:hypothetical protein
LVAKRKRLGRGIKLGNKRKLIREHEAGKVDVIGENCRRIFTGKGVKYELTFELA